MISINLKGEYRADPWDYVQPRTFPGWFLAKRDRGGCYGMAGENYFDCREKAAGRRPKLLREGRRTDIMVVEYAVDVWPLEGRLQFNYRSPEGTIDMESVHGQFEQFWRQETLHQADRVAWYGGEMLALMGTGSTALNVAEDRQIRDVNSFVVLSRARPSMHTTGWARQILQECRHSVHAELFYRAAEVGMKALVVAESGSRTLTHELGHNLRTVWAQVSEERRCEINRIFDLEYRQGLPASEASFDDLVEEYGAEPVKGGKPGVYNLLRYRGDDPKPLPDPNIARHLWKMASALQLHYMNEVAGFAVMLHGVLTGYRNTIH